MNKNPVGGLPNIVPGELVYQDKAHKIYRVNANFGSYSKEYFVTNYGKRAAVILVRNDEILLVRQYRLLINRLSWEIPGGKVNDGEPPDSAAIRECYEETGILCKEVKPLLFFHLGLDITDNPTYLFFSENYSICGKTKLDQHEVVDIEWISLERCLEMVFRQEILDTLSILSILAYHTVRDGRARIKPQYPLLENYYLNQD